MSLVRDLKNIIGSKQEIITAMVTATGTGTARVQRPGQTASTKSIPVASGVTVVANDWVEVILLNGSINTALITRKIR